jgi:hypothetical protein
MQLRILFMNICYECDVAHNNILFWDLSGETVKRIVPAGLLHDSESRPPEYERDLYYRGTKFP